MHPAKEKIKDNVITEDNVSYVIIKNIYLIPCIELYCKRSSSLFVDILLITGSFL